ncbi:hypothetical protein T05_8982 [Trichinella murrelli]|uniref:Uncharacterized protein n=1 Tax=Trichinella murrelli TaxID=144512 RepID=A0A0V0SZS8_9BILA|nr:hypothetical protein T05_8982 [Trichinella murrelli]
MSKNISIPKFNHPGSVSRKFHFGCFPPFITKKAKFVSKAYFRKSQKQQRL